MHTIKFVAQHTGLSQHTIRAWERRYGALLPDRTATNRRLYSAEDIEKLKLLQRALKAGHTIGRVAGLSTEALQQLLSGSDTPVKGVSDDKTSKQSTPEQASFLKEALAAVAKLNGEVLEYTLTRAAAILGSAAVIEHIILPLLETAGSDWASGASRPAYEHLASSVVRTFLGRTLTSFQPSSGAPRLIVTTPRGQLHELGALMAAVTAASEGWRSIYLGPNLPAEEIAVAAHQSGASAIALSIVYPSDDATLEEELNALRKHIGQKMPILTGGRSAAGYARALKSIGAVSVEDLPRLRIALDALQFR